MDNSLKAGDLVIAKYGDRYILGTVRHRIDNLIGLEETTMYKVDLDDTETGLIYSNLFPEKDLTKITKEVADVMRCV